MEALGLAGVTPTAKGRRKQRTKRRRRCRGRLEGRTGGCRRGRGAGRGPRARGPGRWGEPSSGGGRQRRTCRPSAPTTLRSPACPRPSAEPDRRSIHRVDEIATPGCPHACPPPPGPRPGEGGCYSRGVLSPPTPRGTRDGVAAWSSWARYSREKRRRHVGSCRRRRPGTGAPLELGGEVLPGEAEEARGEDLEPHALAALVLHLHRRRMQGPVRPPRPMHRRQNRQDVPRHELHPPAPLSPRGVPAPWP